MNANIIFQWAKKIAALCCTAVATFSLNAQNVGISPAPGSSPDPSAGLDVNFTNKGVLVPRVALTARNSNAPIGVGIATSLLVYNTATAGTYPNNVTPGYYYWDGAQWQRLMNGVANGWQVNGNTLTGTLPASPNEFIGTINAADWIIRTNNTERMRVKSGGQVVVNNTTPLAGDVFSSYAVGTNIAISGYANGAFGFGVYGFNSNTNGTGVLGVGNNVTPTILLGGSGGAFSSSNVGVFGYGENTPFSWGVYGLTNNGNGTGVMGHNNVSGSTAGIGVFGVSNATGGSGVAGYIGVGLGNHFAATAVSGIANSSIAGGRGGAFACDNATGIGVQGQSNGSTGMGVYGYNNSSGGYGVYGYNGATNTNLGGAVGVVGYSNASTITTYLSAAVYGLTPQTNTPNMFAFYGQGRFAVTGAKSAVVPTSKGQTLLYCMESPEVWFEDFGSGQLQNGYAKIILDPLFLETVTINDKHPMHVFIQLEGQCDGGVYVVKNSNGFEVYQNGNNTSNAKFSYRIVAKRKGNENERLETILPIKEPRIVEYAEPKVIQDKNHDILIKQLNESRK
jgi:hypothetical protein